VIAMKRRRALDWVLLVTVTVMAAGIFARGIALGLRTGFGQLRLNVSSAPGSDAYPFVLSAGPWKELEPGDRIEAVDGEDLLGSSAVRFYDRAIRAARERGFASIRPSRGGTSFETRLGLTPVPLWWAEMLCAALQFLAGLLLLVRAPHWHLARRNFAMLAGASALSAAFDWKMTGIRGTWLEVSVGGLVITCTAGLLVWNSQEFTRSARPVPRLHRALAIAGTTALGVNYLMRDYLPHTWVAEWALATAPRLFTLGLCILGLARAYLRSDRLEQRQLRWVILGFCVTFVATGFATVSSFTSAATFGRWVATFSNLGIPAGILISVIGYRWLDVDRLISAATSYTIVGVGVLGTALAVLPGVSQVTAPLLGVDPSTVQWLLTLALVLAAIPAHRFLWPRIDQRMFAERSRRMLGFARLIDDIGSYASAPELVRMAGERINALLEPESIAAYARNEGQFTPVLTRGSTNRESSFEADSPLVRVLEQRSKPLWADASELDPFDRAALETLGVELIVPIRGREAVVAFACLGRKRSGDIYTPQEVAHLGAVASRCSEVLLRLTPEPAAERERQVFHREGDLWTIASSGKEIRLRDMRGLHYLATLLREPGREFAATDLATLASGTPLRPSHDDPALQVVSGLGDAGEPLDARARAAYRERLAEIELERAEAERNGDLGRLARTSEEREALLAELVAAAQGRHAASHAERARVAVTKAIRSALERISERHPELGAHLSATIRRGHLCAYVPDPRTPSDWET
jgi:hypothetical protein